MGIHTFFTAHPILNTFLAILLGSTCYLFSQLYTARMLFIHRKRMGLVRIRCLHTLY